MKHRLPLFICVLLAGQAIAQKERFDIASFVAPAGWQRSDSNGVLLFSNSRTANNLTSFCQIFIFPSRESRDQPLANFNAEWNARVVAATGDHADPQPQAAKPQKGWTAVTGHANLQQSGIAFTCIMVSATGYGRVMSVVVNIAGPDFRGDAQKFLDKMDLDATAAGMSGGGTPGMSGATGVASLDEYQFATPAGWGAGKYPDGILLQPNPNPERCNITLHLLRQAGASLRADAERDFAEVFRGFVPKSLGTQNVMIRGTSQQGWDYFIIKRAIGMPGGNYQTLYGFVCVIRLGDQLASVSGISKDPLVSGCFGLNLTDVWPKFFYSLHFRDWNGGLSQPDLMKRLAGVWIMATATAGDRLVFAPNGRFANAAASQRYAGTTTSVLSITDAYFGNGAYSLKGYNVFMTEDADKSRSTTGWYRLEEETTDGDTWRSKLYLLRKSNVDGADYEVCFNRESGG